MIELARCVLREIRLKLKEPFRISSGTTHERRILLVEVTDADGAMGWGECAAGEYPNYSSETIDTAWLAIRSWITPIVLGRRFDDPCHLAGTVSAAFRGHRMAKAAVEMAVWELDARRRSVSLAEALGGTRATVDTGISIGIQPDPVALVERVRRARAEGYRRVKVKIQPGADIAFVRAARAALDEAVPLMADANSAYTLSDLPILRQLDEFRLLMIEQPLGQDDLVRHAELQQALETPLCLDESITSVERAEDMVRLGSGRIINIKPARVGGFMAARAIHDVAARHDVPVWCGGMLESGVGRAHNVALASLPNFRLPGDLSPSRRYWERDIVVPEWTMHDGSITVPRDRPGMGVEVDREFVEALTVRTETLAS
jgi:O-succinylbenzoate synthase